MFLLLPIGEEEQREKENQSQVKDLLGFIRTLKIFVLSVESTNQYDAYP